MSLTPAHDGIEGDETGTRAWSTGHMESIEVDYRYSREQLEALFRQARQEDVEHSGHFDTGSAALSLSLGAS